MVSDPAAALVELDAFLALAGTATLDAAACARAVELVAAVPGRRRALVRALGRQRDAAAVEALLQLPPETEGLVEALFAAYRHGVVRLRPDGLPCPHMLALEFRSSGARNFPRLVARATAAVGEGLERLRVGDKIHYRLALVEGAGRAPGPSLPERARALELDLEALHRDLARLRGVRLWLNGWCFDDRGPLRPRTRAPLVHGWFEWARAC